MPIRLGIGLGSVRSGASLPLIDLNFESDFTPGVMSAAAWSAATTSGVVARASNNATVRSSATVVTNAATDEARIYYDGTTTGLLIEPAATNLVPDALDGRDTAGWTSTLSATVAQSATLGPSGAQTTRFSGFSASGNATYITSAQTAKASSYQLWYRATTGSPGAVAQPLLGTFSGQYVQVTPDSTWRYYVANRATQTGTFYFSFSDFFAGAQAGAGVGVDFLASLAQFELTNYATSIIRRVNGVGGSDVRAGDRYKWPAATVIATGRLNMYCKFVAQASLTDLPAGDLAILHGANFDVTIDQATGVMSVLANAQTVTCSAIVWTSGQSVELIVEFGGTTKGTLVYASIAGGVWTLIGTSGGAPQGALSTASAVDFFNDTAAGQIPMLLQRLTVYT